MADFKKISLVTASALCIANLSLPVSAAFQNDFPMDMDNMMGDSLWGMGDYSMDQHSMFMENDFVLDNMNDINDALFFGAEDLSPPVFEITDMDTGLPASIEDGDWSSAFNDFYASSGDELADFGGLNSDLLDMPVMEIPIFNEGADIISPIEYAPADSVTDLQSLFFADFETGSMPVDANAVFVDNPETANLFQDTDNDEVMNIPEFDFNDLNQVMDIEIVEAPEPPELPAFPWEEQGEGEGQGEGQNNEGGNSGENESSGSGN